MFPESGTGKHAQKVAALLLAGLLLLPGVASGQQSLFALDPAAESAEPVQNLSAAQILEACAARMAFGPVRLAGNLNMRKRYGVSLRQFPFIADANFQGSASTFRFTLGGGDGQAPRIYLAQRTPGGGLTLTRPDGGPAPAPTDAIEGTDLSWLDASFDFVWWKNPVLHGTDRVKGRECVILEAEPPAPLPNCARARLWIDRSQFVILQAEQLRADGRAMRRLWIRSVQKVDDCWMPRDLEVETVGSGHRTRLHFDDVSFPEAPAAAANAVSPEGPQS